MSKFQVGDIVRRTTRRHGRLAVGDTRAIVEIDRYGSVKVQDDYSDFRHQPENLELVYRPTQAPVPQTLDLNTLKRGDKLVLRVEVEVLAAADDDGDVLIADGTAAGDYLWARKSYTMVSKTDAPRPIGVGDKVYCRFNGGDQGEWEVAATSKGFAFLIHESRQPMAVPADRLKLVA